MFLKIPRLTPALARAHAREGPQGRKIKDTHNSRYQISSQLKSIVMKTLQYQVLLRKEEDGTYTVIVPSLPGCLTFGRTEAIEGFVACMIARGEDVPVESCGSMVRTIAVEANT